MKKRTYKWLPRTLEGLAPWFANFAFKFAGYYTSLGFVAADLAQVENDSVMVQWLLDAQHGAQTNLDAFRAYRDETLYGEKGDPTPVEPPAALPPMPAATTTEILERLSLLVERIQLADNYTEAIGEALGIIAAPGDSLSPDNVKPTIQTYPAQTGYEFAVIVSGRGDADMLNVEIRRMNQETWTTVKSGTGKGVDVTITPTTAGQPEKIEVRVQLLRKNEPYGQPSDPAYVTVTP
jgi:hypothetical protein